MGTKSRSTCSPFPMATPPSDQPASGSARVVVACTIGNVLEWYDFALYGYLAPITAQLFFPASDALAALIDSYAVFALGFLARPFGGLIFGHIGDRLGRQTLLAASVAMMALPTFLIGLLPTFASAGYFAPLALTLLRLAQGLSAGGEFSGSIILLVEHAPPARRGLHGSVANSGAMIGSLLGAGMGWLVSSLLPADALTQWGWRIPFLTGIVVGLFGLWIRLRLPDSPTYARLAASGDLPGRPLRQALRGQRREMLITAGLNWVVSAGYYIAFVWMVTAMSKVSGLAYSVSLAISTLGILLGLLATPLFGHLSDRFGRRRLLSCSALATAVLAVPILMAGSAGGIAAAAVAQFGLALLVAAFLGTLPAVFVSLHASATRCTALALGYNLALALFGGTAPLISALLFRLSGWPAAPGLYLAATALVCLALVGQVPDSEPDAL